MDYRAMFDHDYIGAWDLTGDHVVVIRTVKGAELTGEGGRKTKKPVIYFQGKEKGMAINKTNGKVIAAMYGNDTRGWAGKAITIFPTTTDMTGKTVDCIRVRPQIPQGNGKGRSSQQRNDPQHEPVDPDSLPDPGPNGEEEPPL